MISSPFFTQAPASRNTVKCEDIVISRLNNIHMEPFVLQRLFSAQKISDEVAEQEQRTQTASKKPKTRVFGGLGMFTLTRKWPFVSQKSVHQPKSHVKS